MNPADYHQAPLPPKKSSAKPWLIGGLGCLALIVIVIAAGAYMVVKSGFFDNMRQLTAATTAAMQAPAVVDAFGTPIEVSGQEQKTTKANGRSVTEITQTLKGPKGEGKLVMTMEQAEGSVMPKFTGVRIITPTGAEIAVPVAGTAAPQPAPAPAAPAAPEAPAVPAVPAPVQ